MTTPDTTPLDPSRLLDWHDEGENGRYSCRCVSCGREFIGHKRRTTCPLCAVDTTPEALRALAEDAEIFAQAEEAGLPIVGPSDLRKFRDALLAIANALAVARQQLAEESVDGPQAWEANDILGKPGHYKQ